MNITEVRIKLVGNSDDRLRAFCSITIDDCLVIRDLKIIEGTTGPFVAMPSRKLTAHCQRCKSKNPLRADYCNQCGVPLRDQAAFKAARSQMKFYADIAHPINAVCRDLIQNRVVEEFAAELERAGSEGYASRYDDDYVTPSSSETGISEKGTSETGTSETGTSQKGFVDPADSGPQRPHASSKRRNSRDPMDDFGAGIF